MEDLFGTIKHYINTNHVDVDELINSIRTLDLIRNNRLVGLIKESMTPILGEETVGDVKSWNPVNEGEVDFQLNDGRKIKIFIGKNDRGERILRKDVDLKDYWLVLIGRLSDKNLLGYTLKGCTGEESEEYENVRQSGARIYRVFRLEGMRNINLCRRLEMGI